jgi:hypothetical protein
MSLSSLRQKNGIIKLDFSFVYYGRLASGDLESEPRIYWWTSTIRNKENGTVTIEVGTLKEGKEKISDELSVSIPIDASNPLRHDDCIWAECQVMSPNDEGMKVGSRAGVFSIYIKDVYDQVKKKGRFSGEFDLLMPTVENYKKGSIRLSLRNPRIMDKVSFNEFPGLYEFTEENKEFVMSFVENYTRTIYYVFSEQASQDGNRFLPMDPKVEGILAPYWEDVTTVPGLFFWIRYSDYSADENFMLNLAKIALSRYEISEESFIQVVNNQFEQSHSYDEQFTTCCAVIGLMISIVSISLYYKSDEVYTIRKSTSSEKKEKKRIIESFNDALELLGGDCEDLASLINVIFYCLEMGDPLYSDPSYEWKKKGSWKSELLQCMQRIAHIYVGCGSLGSVTAPKVGSEKNDGPVLIDSETDKESEVGGHMWYELIPLAKFEQYVNSISKKKRFSAYPDEERAQWELNIPHIVAEGTGWIFPLIKPLKDYYSPAEMEETKKIHQLKMLTCKYVSNFTSYFKLGQFEKLPELTEDIPNARYSSFYRTSTQLFTYKFEDMGIGQFIWIYLSDRIDESEKKKQSDKPELKWGVHMRDKLSGKQNIGLLTFPGFLPEERNAIKSLLRQFQPRVYPHLSVNNDKDPEIVSEFQRNADSITKSRKENNTSPSVKINIIFRGREFADGQIEIGESNRPISSLLLDELKRDDRIIGCELFYERITDDIHNVRIVLDIVIPSNDEMNARISKMKKKKIIDKGEIGDGYSVSLKIKDRYGCVDNIDFKYHTEHQIKAFKNGIQGNDPEVYMCLSEMRAYLDALDIIESGHISDITIVDS